MMEYRPPARSLRLEERDPVLITSLLKSHHVCEGLIKQNIFATKTQT